MKVEKKFFDKYKDLINAYAVGLGTLFLMLTVLIGSSMLGIPPLVGYPFLNLIAQSLLWDPMLGFVNLHAIILPAIAFTSALLKKDWKGAQLYAQSFITTLGATFLTKYFVGRVRPNSFNNASFFSGHTSSAFSGAAFIHHRYNLLFAAPLYVIASGIACARVIKAWHHPSDVMAGAGVALLFSYNLIEKQAPFKPQSDHLDIDTKAKYSKLKSS